MFLDLVKARKADKEDVSPERIRELMDELFSGSDDGDMDDDDMDKGMRYDMDDMDDMDKGSMKEMYKGDDDDNMRDDSDDDSSDDSRRELMNKVYSLVDNLSEEELKAIIDSRTMKKALVMGVIDNMATGELSELVSQMQANGIDSMNKAEEVQADEMEKGDEMDDDELDADELEKAMELVKKAMKKQKKDAYGNC